MAKKKSSETVSTTCCIAGGGPAGMMLGLLLARAGVDVLVLEKHNDFLRDFRGDTVHPSTLELMDELGFLNEFLKLPHQKLDKIKAVVGNDTVTLGDFSRISAKCRFVALMPQWHFLDFLAKQAARYPSFKLRMNAEVKELVQDEGQVRGVIVKTADGDLKVNAHLVVGADGRASVLRQYAGLPVVNVGAPMDVLWMRLSRREDDPAQTMGRIVPGAMFIMLNREEYWQCGYLIHKGALEEYREEGIEKFRERITESAPFLADRVHELQSFDDIKLLTVKIDHLSQWSKEGFLCIGDAAHAMSPVGGVGINLAIQDAVAAANILYKPLLNGSCTNAELQKVQARRMYPTRMTQRIQVLIQNNVIQKAISGTKVSIPWFVKLFELLPNLRALPAQMIGVGFRPENIHTPDAQRQQSLAEARS